MDLVSEVISDRLYLAGCDVRLSPQLFYELKIKQVITLGSAIELKYYQSEPVPDEIDYHEFVLEDKYKGDIVSIVKKAVGLIEESINKEEAVLVHCAAGLNRSATVVIAYLMKSRHLTVQEALLEVRRIRPRVNPNDNFLKQL